MNADFNFSPVTREDVSELMKIFGGSCVSVEKEKLARYSLDEVAPHLWEKKYTADVVCFAENSAQLSELMKFANRRKIPVTPRGAGTGLSGGAVPAFGGIEVSFEKMNKILEVDAENLTVTTEPGVVTSEINRAASEYGLMYAGDPCSGDASYIGGNVAENAGGNKVVKYGATGASVLGLEVVLPDGRITAFGGKTQKDVTGYDFRHLMVGSEGTLGLISKITLRLVPKPLYAVGLLVPFASSDRLIEAVSKTMRESHETPSSIEYIDGSSIVATESYLNTKFRYSHEADAFLLLEYEGNNKEALCDLTEKVGDVCLQSGALEVFVADNKTTRQKMWKCRKNIAEAVWSNEPMQLSNEDIVVPFASTPRLLEAIKEISRNLGVAYAAYGHLGDGNMHITFYMRRRSDEWEHVMETARNDLYAVVSGMGGKLTGEHGVGLKRAKYLSVFLDEAQIELIKKVKLAFDPNNILNPGKIVQWEKGGTAND